jgi:hypothetical protein
LVDILHCAAARCRRGIHFEEIPFILPRGSKFNLSRAESDGRPANCRPSPLPHPASDYLFLSIASHQGGLPLRSAFLREINMIDRTDFWRVYRQDVSFVEPGPSIRRCPAATLPEAAIRPLFRLVNYPTRGYGDIISVTRWRLLGPVTAMNGVLLLGWSTAVIFDVPRKSAEKRRNADRGVKHGSRVVCLVKVKTPGSDFGSSPLGLAMTID